MNCHQLLSAFCRLLAILLLLGSLGSCCAPGRTRYTRRPPKKLCPLVYKQHVPNTAELSPAASGPATSGISRHDASFSQLVPNYNEYIIFQDDEGTGEDRMMTPRAKERLDMLAVSVMNHWPGVRLRVLDSWWDGDRGQGNSLHREGRAVDIATSDRDRGKLGMLARLAVEVQFDWVFYEHRGRVHCSVKTEPSSSSRYGAGCFSADTEVRTDSRVNADADVSVDGGVGVRMDRLRVGDRVLTVDDTGTATYSPVLAWLHRSPRQQAEFLRMTTSSGLQLSVTPRHLLFVLPANCSAADSRRQMLSQAVARLAEDVSVGDFLLVGSLLRRDRVETIRRELKHGVYAPLTEHGSVLVDGALASCYAEVNSHQLAHKVLQPLRWWHSLQRLVGWSPSSHSVTSEVHWYARVLIYIAEYLLPQGILPHAINQI